MITLKTKYRIILLQFLFTVVLLFVWELLGTYFLKIFFIVGKPSEIYKELKDLIFEGNLFRHMLITGGEALCGLVIGTLLGSIAGLLLWFSKTVSKIIRPFVIALGTFPVFAFAPLMIMWFGVGFGMKVAMATFSTIFVSFNQANKGANLVSVNLIDSMVGMNATKNQIFFKGIVPGSVEWVLSSMRINIGFALLGAFIGEFIAASEGLGYLILKASGLYNIPRAFAASFGIVSLALILDLLGTVIERNRFILLQAFSINYEIRKYQKERKRSMKQA